MMTNLLFNRLTAIGKRLAMVLTILVVGGIGSVWGATAEFLPSNFSGQGTSGTGSAISATVNGVTFACDKGYGTTQFRCYGKSTITISSSNTITAISFTFSGSYTGGLETSYTNLNTNSWEHTLSSQARITACVVTYKEASADPHTVTLNAGPGTCAASVTEASAGAGVTLPTPTLNGCGEWTFAGWKTTSAVTTETTTKPTLIPAGTYKPTTNITLSAVYQRTEGGGGGGSTTHAFGWENADDESKWTISNFSAKGVYSSYKSAGSYAASTNSKTTGYIQYTEKLSPTDISCKYTKATSNTNSTSKFIIQTSTDGSSWTDAATGATMNNVTQGTFKTLSWTGSLSDVYVRIYYTGTNAVRVLDEVSITATGGGSTTYYHSTPDCGSTEPSLCLIQKEVAY